MIPELKEIAGHVGERSQGVREGRRLRAEPARAAARPRRQQREGHGPPRDHPDERAAGRHRADARRAAHLRHGRPALPGRVPPAGRVREHDGADRGRRRELPLARQGHARGRLARRLRRGAARRAEGPGRRERRGRGRRSGAPAARGGRGGALHRGRRRRARDQAAAALRRGRAAGRHGRRRQARRGRRAARGHEGLGHRHARHARVHHRAPDRRRLHRARRPPPAADRQGHPGHRPAGRARAHEPEPDRRLGAPPARHRARRRQPRGVHAGHREVHREARSPTCATCRPRRCASSGATSTSSARAAARAT